MDAVGIIGFQRFTLHFGAVNAQLPMIGFKLEQGFDTPTLVPKLGGGVLVLLCDRLARPVNNIARAKTTLGDDNTVCRSEERRVGKEC